MITLSIRQPWAWLIINGYKTVENRSWATKYRGPLQIHAGKAMACSTEELAELRQALLELDVDMPVNLPTGGIVGSVDLVDCVTTCADEDDASWHEPGMYGFILRNAKTQPFRAVAGRLGFFDA